MLGALRTFAGFVGEILGLFFTGLPTLARALADGNWRVARQILGAYRRLLVATGYMLLSLGYFGLSLVIMAVSVLGGISLVVVALGSVLILFGIQFKGVLSSVFVLAGQLLFLSILLGVGSFVLLMRDGDDSTSGSSPSSHSSSSSTSYSPTTSYSPSSFSSKSLPSTKSGSGSASQITQLTNDNSDPVTTLSASYEDLEVDEYGQLVEES